MSKTKQHAPESPLVDHAKRELKIIGEAKFESDKLVQMVEIFASMGHSGGSAGVAIAQLNALLQFENLSPLTDDEEEWYFHGNSEFGLSGDAWNNGEGGVWQNKRNGEAFSNDGGKTYYLLSETKDTANPTVIHHSRYHKPCSTCGARERHQHSPRCMKSLETQIGI